MFKASSRAFILPSAGPSKTKNTIMHRYLWLLTFSFFVLTISQLSAQTCKTNIYFIPGLGTDYRLFQHIELNEQFDTHYVHYDLPAEGMSMEEYACQLAVQIDTTQPFVLVGASLGGMLATEMTEFMNPEKVIIMASAKCRQELPARYRVQSRLPFYKWVSGKMIKGSTRMLQPIVEPDRNREKATFIQMLKAKDPRFMKRTVAMIVTWKRETCPESVVHIHGNKDHTIPIRNVDYDYQIEKGSHVMTLTRSKELSKIINQILAEI